MEEAKKIVEQYTPFAYAIAFRLTGNQAAAGDLVQNAMLRVLKSWRTYDPTYKVEQWLYRIIRNLFIDRIRKEKRLKENRLQRGPDDERLSYSDTLVDPSPTPETVMEREQKRDAVSEAVGGLPLEMRMAVTLVDLEGYSYEDAARILEIPASTLGVRVFRGRKMLRKSLKSFMEGKLA